MAERATFADTPMRAAELPPGPQLWRTQTDFEEGPVTDGGIMIEPPQLASIVHLVEADSIEAAMAKVAADIKRANAEAESPVRITRCTAELLPPVLR